MTLTADGTAVEPDSERVILRVPKAKIAGTPSGFPGGPANAGPGHVGGAGLDFDSDGNLYLGVGDDVSPNAPGPRPLPADGLPLGRALGRAQDVAEQRRPARQGRPHHASLGTSRRTPSRASGATYTVPAGNMFPVGTAKTRPEIYAMGFRQPFTLHTDPENPGIVVVGEFCHDNGTAQADRSPAGTCEWNLVDRAGFHGWPFCVGDNSPRTRRSAGTTRRPNATTNQRTTAR